jgi:hypothetical protein
MSTHRLLFYSVSTIKFQKAWSNTKQTSSSNITCSLVLWYSSKLVNWRWATITHFLKPRICIVNPCSNRVLLPEVIINHFHHKLPFRLERTTRDIISKTKRRIINSVLYVSDRCHDRFIPSSINYKQTLSILLLIFNSDKSVNLHMHLLKWLFWCRNIN